MRPYSIGCGGAPVLTGMRWLRPAAHPPVLRGDQAQLAGGQSDLEMCWLDPDDSVGPRGSGMELRNVYWNGQLVLRRAHAPMLFAEYKDGNGGDCYRDWKDTRTSTLAAAVVQNQLGDIPAGGNSAITACDRSTHPTNSYGTCPFQLPIPGGYTCAQGIAIENMGDHVRLTAQYDADWYMYASRMNFMQTAASFRALALQRPRHYNAVPTGTINWRFEFDVDGLATTWSASTPDQTG